MVIEQFNGRKTIMCVGGTDTGKTTFVKEVVGELAAAGKPYIHIDLDMGQSTIGPPSTIGLRTSEGAQYLYFVGNISPFGVVRELEGGLTRFRRIMDGLPDRQTIVDTTGLVEGPFGWALKRMKIAMLGVDFIVFFDKAGDTQHLRDHIAEMEMDIANLILCPSQFVRARTAAERARYRKTLFDVYFENAPEIRLSTANRRVVRGPWPIEEGQLTGLIGSDGFLISLALFSDEDPEGIIVRAAVASPREIRVIRFGRYNPSRPVTLATAEAEPID